MEELMKNDMSLIETIIDTIKNWVPLASSLMVGSISLLDSLGKWLDLLFVSLGCVGLVLSIILTVKKIRAFNKKP